MAQKIIMLVDILLYLYMHILYLSFKIYFSKNSQNHKINKINLTELKHLDVFNWHGFNKHLIRASRSFKINPDQDEEEKIV